MGNNRLGSKGSTECGKYLVGKQGKYGMWKIIGWEAREVWNVENNRLGSKGSMECGK